MFVVCVPINHSFRFKDKSVTLISKYLRKHVQAAVACSDTLWPRDGSMGPERLRRAASSHDCGFKTRVGGGMGLCLTLCGITWRENQFVWINMKTECSRIWCNLQKILSCVIKLEMQKMMLEPHRASDPTAHVIECYWMSAKATSVQLHCKFCR